MLILITLSSAMCQKPKVYFRTEALCSCHMILVCTCPCFGVNIGSIPPGALKQKACLYNTTLHPDMHAKCKYMD